MQRSGLSRYRTQSPAKTTHGQSFFQGQGAEAEVAETSATLEEPVEEALLSPAQVTSAIAYMRNSYSRESITALRNKFNLSDGHIVDQELVMAIAQYQDTNNMEVDGKLGPDTYEVLMAEGDAAVQDVVIFRVMSPLGGRMEHTTGGGTHNFLGHFTIEIHLPPGEDCADYEYRQFICARVEMLPAGADPTGPLTNLRPLFLNPGGLNAIPNYAEDGNTSLNPQRMGHRSGPGSTNPVNRYLNIDDTPNQRSGCIYRGEDHPGITGRVANTGEQYEFDFRFMGVVRHKERGIIARKFWSVRDDFVI